MRRRKSVSQYRPVSIVIITTGNKLVLKENILKGTTRILYFHMDSKI